MFFSVLLFFGFIVRKQSDLEVSCQCVVRGIFLMSFLMLRGYAGPVGHVVVF